MTLHTTLTCHTIDTPLHACIYLFEYTSSFSWKYETGTVITFLFIQMVHGMEMMWLVLVCLLLKFGQSLKPWSKLKILLHPNTLFLNLAKKDIVFCWVPSHNGIKGNEKAHFSAKSALDLSRTKVGVPYSDFKHCISQYILSTWQDYWNGADANKLHYVNPVLGDWQSSYSRCRKDEVVLCHASIGDTHLTHTYILRKYPPPQCEHGQCIPTVRHILVECNHFARERKDIIGRDVMESFKFHSTITVLFLKQIEFYYNFYIPNPNRDILFIAQLFTLFYNTF